MTRKRFVKLCMSRGYSRNKANRAAQVAVSRGCTYNQAYFAVRIADGDAEAVESVRRFVLKVAEVINRIVPVWVQCINEAMPQIIEKAREIQRQREAAKLIEPKE